MDHIRDFLQGRSRQPLVSIYRQSELRETIKEVRS
jgi:hypothetical protein